MQNTKTTAGETARKRTLVIFRDCHVKNNLIVPIVDGYEERFYRNFARRMGWLCTVRRAAVEASLRLARGQRDGRGWEKPLGLSEAERPKLGGAFSLELSEIMEGGAL